MSLPQPPVALTGSCSVIFENTLYSYSGAGFQSLALEEGAEWETLADGESVDGAVCVGSTPADSSNAALYVVGGKSSSPDYPGLQKFTYSTGKWETIMPQVLVTQNRVYHSATYINSTDAILVYSGSTDGEAGLSSQTFTIAAAKPHDVLAYQSIVSPPGVAPILLPWSESKAVLIGGNPTNNKVMLFDASVPAGGASWIESGTTLAEPLSKNTTEVKAAIVQADDDSKHLYTFDMSTSPNRVNRTVLLGANGTPMTDSAPIVTVVSSRGEPRVGENLMEKRDLTVDNWPTYNSTLAPKATRTDYAIASDSKGMVVMSGGNEDEVLSLFDARENSWQNATALFGAQENDFSIQSSPSSTSSSTSSPTANSPAESSTTAAAAAAESEGGLGATAILGIVLGVIFGVAILLMMALFLIKRSRRKQNFAEAGHARRASGFPDEKDILEQNYAQASGGHFRGHKQQDSQGSFSSMAILVGKAQKPAIQRKASNDTKRSSVSSIFNKQFKSTIGRPQAPPDSQPDYIPRDEKVSFAADTIEPKPRNGPALNRDGSLRRSSGWNRYWSGGSSLNILGFGNNKRETAASEQSSHYSSSNRMTQDSATVPPLLVEGRPEFNRVASASPTVFQHNPRHQESMAGKIERPVSETSSSGYSSGIPASVHEAWEPDMANKAWGADRAPSSAYSQSIVYPTSLGAPGASRPPTGLSRQPQLETANTSSDMSWLNLGENNRQQ